MLNLKVRIGADDIAVELGENESVYVLKKKTLVRKTLSSTIEFLCEFLPYISVFISG